MTQDAEGLKACPFCAAVPVPDGPRAKVAHKQGCYLLRFIGSGQLWLAADETGWNTRAPSPVSALVEALEEAEQALATCYQVCDYPANGKSTQDAALRAVRTALKDHK
jgi:hypothetical protein